MQAIIINGKEYELHEVKKEPTPAEKFFKRWEGKKFCPRVFDPNIGYIKATGISGDGLLNFIVYNKNNERAYSGLLMIHENNFDDYTEYKGKELVWRVPKEGEKHYCLQEGEIHKWTMFTEYDNKTLSTGNLCIKKAPLEHELLLRKLRSKYNQFHEREDDVDFDNVEEDKYYFIKDYDSNKLCLFNLRLSTSINELHFSEAEKAQQFFEENRELYSKLYKIDDLSGSWED